MSVLKQTYSLIVIMTLALLPGCVELYEFRIENEKPDLVIEAEISDLSYNEYLDLPADGRYFTVKLSLTGNVTNERNVPVREAFVTLSDSEGKTWEYTASEVNPGLFVLYDREFKAVQGVEYQLRVALPDGSTYLSDWEALPAEIPGPVGEIGFEEEIRQQYVYKNRERVLDDVRGISVNVGLRSLTGEGPVFYKWDFQATWIYRATLLSSGNPNYRCWITNPYYLSDYVMHDDRVGGYERDLFFMAVEGNDRIFDRISVLVSQYIISEAYYNYWTEIKEQDQRKGLFDPPPFNLISNLHAEDPDQEVYGYFGVVNEQAKRWYFSRLDLEYPVPNTWREFCTNPNLIPPPKCSNCLAYDLGIATNEKPWWWEE